MKVHLILLALIIGFSAHSAAQEPKANWIDIKSDYHFSIRCSKGPIKRTILKRDTYFFRQFYLKWDGIELKRNVYTTALYKPHNWDEGSSYIFKQKSEGGSSIIELSAKKTMLSKGDLEFIEIDLDASGSSALSYFMGGFFTHGNWLMLMQNGVATIKESTSTFTKGKLTSSASSTWENCNLMNMYGQSR